MRQLLIGLLVVLVPLGARAASSNQTLNVEGILRDGSGALQSMAVGLDVSLYASSAAATPFYTQHFDAVPVDSGYFTVELAGAGLAFTAPDAWIGIKVTGDAAELPRVHVDAAPYAFSAGSADALSAACVGCVTNAMLGGSIDGTKVGKVASATSADSATTATTATTADTATNATQLGGVAAASWQRAITPAACPAGQVYSGIAANGTGTCTGQVSVAATANAVAFANITGMPAVCPAGQYLTGYSGGTASCAALAFTASGGTNGSATTVARGDHTHPGVGSGWVKIYDQAYNGNGVQTIPLTPVNGTFTVRILFNGSITNCCGNPSEIYMQTSAGGTTGYSSFIGGETIGGASAYNTSPVQPGFVLGRTATAANSLISFDYELTELANNGGAIGHGAGAVHPTANTTTTLFRAGGVNGYSGSSTSISIAFWNTSNVTGRFTVLQLM